jgi:HAD superfamily phosphoserine phosphatase-like hydrolase
MGSAGSESSAAAAQRASPVVVFDFDGTLVRRDSFLDFSLRYCLRRPLRLLLAVLLLPLAALLSLRSSRRAGSLLLWVMTVLVPTRRFVRELEDYAKRVLPGLASERIFAELGTQRSAGRRVVIATGTVPLLVRSLLRRRGLPPLEVVGSRLRAFAGGLVVETHCTGRCKVRELKRRLGVTRWLAVYTDSHADRALIRMAGHVTLVGPGARTLALTQRMLGPGALRVLPRG